MTCASDLEQVIARQGELVAAATVVTMGCNAALAVAAVAGWVDTAGAGWLAGAVGVGVVGMVAAGRWRG